MNAKHKRLLRLAAEEVESTHSGLGMCVALGDAANTAPWATQDMLRDCEHFIRNVYRPDSPYSDRIFWMGLVLPENKQHRIMALLFAAEAYDDMEGV